MHSGAGDGAHLVSKGPLLAGLFSLFLIETTPPNVIHNPVGGSSGAPSEGLIRFSIAIEEAPQGEWISIDGDGTDGKPAGVYQTIKRRRGKR